MIASNTDDTTLNKIEHRIAVADNNIASQDFLEIVHKFAPISKNIDIMFNNAYIGNLLFLELYKKCINKSNIPRTNWKAFRRTLRAFQLAQFANYALDLDGGWAECGVFTGFSSLMLAEIKRMREPNFVGKNLHLIDSYEGLSSPQAQDFITNRKDTGYSSKAPSSPFQKGHFSYDLNDVKKTIEDYPNVNYHKGWIPEILSDLPLKKWAFVHIDVDLYEPTKGCLEYFVPKMVSGGCIVNDDYQSPLFPGGGIAWREYCALHSLSYSILDSGQSVLIVN